MPSHTGTRTAPETNQTMSSVVSQQPGAGGLSAASPVGARATAPPTPLFSQQPGSGGLSAAPPVGARVAGPPTLVLPFERRNITRSNEQTLARKPSRARLRVSALIQHAVIHAGDPRELRRKAARPSRARPASFRRSLVPLLLLARGPPPRADTRGLPASGRALLRQRTWAQPDVAVRAWPTLCCTLKAHGWHLPPAPLSARAPPLRFPPPA